MSTPVAAAPAVAAQPGAGRRRVADARERFVERRAAVELHLVLSDRPRREVDVRVGEARQHAPAAEVDRLRAGERRLVHADAAGDAVTGDRERARLGQRRVEGANDAVLEDHAPSLEERCDCQREDGERHNGECADRERVADPAIAKFAEHGAVAAEAP